MPMYRREYQLSSRVDTMRWLGILQMILGIIMFIVCVIMVAIDLNSFVDRDGGAFSRHRDDNESRRLVPQPLASKDAVFLAMTMIAIAMGAGCAGTIMSRYEGISYNIPARHLLLVLSVMNGVVSLGYMVFHGQLTFEFIDAEILDSGIEWAQGVLAMMIVMFVLAFFNMVIAFITAIVATFWNPPMDGQPQSPVERFNERPPVIVEEKPYYQRHAYSDYSPYDYSRRTRTMPLPAIKYY